MRQKTPTHLIANEGAVRGHGLPPDLDRRVTGGHALQVDGGPQKVLAGCEDELLGEGAHACTRGGPDLGKIFSIASTFNYHAASRIKKNYSFWFRFIVLF